jgi:hypothetical protein
MTDNVGILEHCLFATPDLREGYCIDDNARALIVAVNFKEEKLIDLYLKFLVSASSPKGFKNDLTQNLIWDKESLRENFGRAMVALMETVKNGIREDQKLTALFLFDQQIVNIKQVDSDRAKAWLIQALCLRKEVGQKLVQVVDNYSRLKLAQGKIAHVAESDSKSIAKKMADDIVRSFNKFSDDRWSWFEDEITYDNGRLPLGLFWAYRLLGDKTYLNVAIKSLDFLTQNIFDSKQKCFSFPGYRGWITRSGTKALFGQQPIEAGSMAECYSLAYEVTRDKKYKYLALKAYDWYHGKNILGVSLINPQTGGVYDGLEKEGVNLNQGAESVLSYLLAWSVIV